MDHTVESQQAVFDLLADPLTHGSLKVRRIDTHAASVFLAGARVFKIKRAVRFPFLDYSTLEKRKTACLAELEVNRPFAPNLYRRVVPITREHDGRLALDGTGTPVEWAVEMHRFDETRTLDRLAETGEIDAVLADALGRSVAAAHRGAPIVDAESWIEALPSMLRQNDAELRETPDLFPASEIDALSRASQNAFTRIRPLLLTRGKLGLVRRGHGDLHLGNIALIEGHPVPFDAIEFDPLIASGDVLYDLAFLLMDLVERGLKETANIVMNRYLAETRRLEDLDALAALPFFLSLRAAIRAKVTAARLKQAEPPAREATADAARTYFRLAGRLLLPAAPTLIAIGGFSGTGKSVLARMLASDIAPVPGAVVLRSDVERKALFGLAETERLSADAYRPEVTAKVYAILMEKARRVIAAGHSAVADAVFADVQERDAISSIATTRKVAFRGFFLFSNLSTRLERIGTRARDASDADVAIARRQESYELGDIDWTRIDASGTPTETLARAKAAFG